MGLSVIIITKDAQGTIDLCLAAVKSIADEIIIIDSGSTDNTLEICRRYTDKVYERDWPGYGIQKQRALDLATQDWVLSLDADEVLEKELSLAIANIVAGQGNYNAYKISLHMFFLGALMNHAGKSMSVRLFKRNSARFSADKVHERIIFDGPIGRLPGYCTHYSYKSLTHWLEKMNTYTSIQAKKKQAKAPRFGVSKAFLKSLFAFFKIYFIKKGFLDGKPGFVYAVNGAISSFYKYLKIAFTISS
jgi:glycosyltransferase involved in cell wall biosynthesis